MTTSTTFEARTNPDGIDLQLQEPSIQADTIQTSADKKKRKQWRESTKHWMNELLKGVRKSFKEKLILDIGLFIYYLATFIYSIVQFALKQEPLAYNIVCMVFSFIGLVVTSCTFAWTIYKHCKGEQYAINQLKNDSQERDDDDEDLDIETLKDLALDIVQEVLIYPGIICSLYGFINEKAWEFDNALDVFHLLLFLFNLWYDALYTKLKYIWAAHKVVLSAFYKSDDNRKTKAGKCCLTFLFFTSHVCLLILMHWLILAIIGVRIYADNFYREITQENGRGNDQGNEPETGGYRATSYTCFMIFCGLYLPVCSVVVFIILNRAWFDDEIQPVCKKIFYVLADKVAYAAVIFLMVPFHFFYIGAFLPDYDSSEFEVDDNARSASAFFGGVFVITFIVFNIKATVMFLLMIPLIIVVACIKYCWNILKQLGCIDD